MNGLLEQLDRWLPQARARVAAHGLAPRLEQIGRIETVGDGIARVSGLPEVRLDELLMLGAGTPGFAFTLEPDAIGCILLGETEALSAGDPVHATGAVLTVPVGEGLLGRVIDPLGAVLDGGAAIEPTRHDRIEPPAPEIVDRDLVTEPLATGVLAIDALFPLGRGQRELIIGDRATGKSALALDTIINQRDSDVICIYVAVGQKSSAVKAAIQGIRTHGALERCLFVVAAPEAPAGLRWLAPYAGFTMGEYFRDQGGHVLVVIDDLTTHATTHRELSLLLRQPPGREAFPGDVFYLHARLLERAAKLSKEKGAGSLSALPIAQTQAGNLSAYIPTNLISITDGQFYLDARLFHEGQRPAVDIGRSVSRVGGKTQPPALRQVSGRLRLEYAQFLELEVFTRFGGMVEARTRRTIEHGRRIRAVLAQGQYQPQPMALQVALLLALDERLLDDLPLEAVVAFRERLPDWLAEHAAGALRRLEAGATLDDDLRASLLEALRALAASLAGS